MAAVALVAGVIPAFICGGLLCAAAYLHGVWRLLGQRGPEEA